MKIIEELKVLLQKKKQHKIHVFVTRMLWSLFIVDYNKLQLTSKTTCKMFSKIIVIIRDSLKKSTASINVQKSSQSLGKVWHPT